MRAEVQRGSTHRENKRSQRSRRRRGLRTQTYRVWVMNKWVKCTGWHQAKGSGHVCPRGSVLRGPATGGQPPSAARSFPECPQSHTFRFSTWFWVFFIGSYCKHFQNTLRANENMSANQIWHTDCQFAIADLRHEQSNSWKGIQNRIVNDQGSAVHWSQGWRISKTVINRKFNLKIKTEKCPKNLIH